MMTVSVSNFALEGKMVSEATAEFESQSERESCCLFSSVMFALLVNFKSGVGGFIWNIKCSFAAKKDLIKDIFHSGER